MGQKQRYRPEEPKNDWKGGQDMLELLLIVGCFSVIARVHIAQETIDKIAAETLALQRELRM